MNKTALLKWVDKKWKAHREFFIRRELFFACDETEAKSYKPFDDEMKKISCEQCDFIRELKQKIHDLK